MKAASLIWACIVELKMWPFKALNEFYECSVFIHTVCVWPVRFVLSKNLIVEAAKLHQWTEFNKTIHKILFSHSPVSLGHCNLSCKLENVCKTGWQFLIFCIDIFLGNEPCEFWVGIQDFRACLNYKSLTMGGKTEILDTNSILNFSNAAQTDMFGKNDRF
jgi:hypothetical protein